MTKQIPRGALLAAVGIAALLLAERRWPRRVRTQAEPARTARNVALGAMALAVVTAGQGGARQLAARVERDLIVGSATRAATARDATRAHGLRAELEARGAAIRDLAARCVASVNPAPRLAVPDVAALGPVPSTRADVDAYLARLATVGRALNLAQAAYATAMDERDELRGRLEAYAIKATRAGGSSSWTGKTPDPADDLGELFRRAQEVLSAEPSDMARARALVAAHQAYLASRSAPAGAKRETTRETTRDMTRGTT